MPQVLQRNLPRPLSLDLVSEHSKDGANASLRERAEQLLIQEMLTLLRHDAATYPLKVPRPIVPVLSASAYVHVLGTNHSRRHVSEV